MAAAPTPQELARCIEATLCKADVTRREIEALCAEARRLGCQGVCVSGASVELAYALLEDTDFKVTALVGFPLGAVAADVKRYEAEVAVDDGAHEIELMLNAGRLKDGDRQYVLRELRDVVEAADERPVKVILETGLLTREEQKLACELILDSGAKAVTVPVGFRTDGTDAETVKWLREILGDKMGLKVAGNIPNTQFALDLLAAGATRIGTTTASALVEGHAGPGADR